MSEQPRSGTQAVDRAIHVLNCFAGSDPVLSVSELAQRARLPVSTTYRLAQALVRGGLLEQDAATDRYRVGSGLADLAGPALARLGFDTVAQAGIEAVAPHVYALAAGIRITVNLNVADKTEAVSVLQARPPVWFCANQVQTARRPLHASAPGRAMLAFAPGDRMPAPLRESLHGVRRTGFAVEEIDAAEPVRTVAVPILSQDRQVWGSLSIQARSIRLNDELVRTVVPAMRQLAGRLGPYFHTAVATANTADELKSP
ncbi:IclR family transcriptional regulator [Nocardia sp. alder85J]|uniref:IclR family transcriptional regulator n=1 Tax=Nocardia sp. alder85J TaxID=2862949 RepID=UPI001CD2A80D|nr:IclR family transcriptional regulator [Nocardia sp. alder85J]MCX4095441.1 IclR family transcriptional regulator [Nocardia sp. alder85J]